jgi:sugar lactone lactonase YvrE
MRALHRLEITMMRRSFLLVMVLMVCCGAAIRSGNAQGTKLWTQSRYDEMERGTAEGVAIRNDGRLEVAPAGKLLYTTGGSYIWSITADGAGNAYLGRGGTVAGSAIVTRLAPDGTATDIFAGKELAVQALAAMPDGTILAATSPDGKVYRIKPDMTASVVFNPAETNEKPKYLWDFAVAKSGDVYVAAGAPAVVYRIPSGGGKAKVLFRTADEHIRCLLLAPDGTLYAGSDGAGVVYKIDTAKPAALPFAVYSAAKREITALAMDATGNVYAAGVGGKGNVPLPNLPVTGGTGTPLTFVQAGSSTAVSTNTVIPDGSEIYRIAPDGTPLKLLALKEDIVYALTMRNGSLLAATGNRGRVYRIDTGMPGRWTDIAHLDAAQGVAFAPEKAGLLIATSNNGRVFRLSDAGTPEATFTSAVFDAQIFSQWGRAEVLPVSASFDLYLRSGNVENPAMGWSDWIKATPNSGNVGVPGARYVQWKAVLRGTATVESVGLNYLAKNIAPVVDEVVAQPGARVSPAQPAANTTVQVNFPTLPGATPATVFQTEANTTPLTAQKDRGAVTVRWSARDDNGDDLIFSLYYKGEGEANWRLLKDKISDRFYSFDSSLLPDGAYAVKVLASDSPVHTASEALTGEKASGVFVIDTTAPVPSMLTASMEGGNIHARFEAKDATSPIGHAEYSVDAGPWQYLEPSGNISDSLSEKYDFVAAVPPTTIPLTDAREHVIAIRVYDRYENVATAKAVVR